ncbi:hypothetical protein AB0L13_37205 [Saccharopolyspora shandongensis]|uniref:hypothetical protein n=1 Tax=Saccharopolyspora shandongensis TaxID=418495 RepID=UPI00343D1E99
MPVPDRHRPDSYAIRGIDAISRRAALLTEADPALIGAVVELAARWGPPPAVGGRRHRRAPRPRSRGRRGVRALSMRAGRAVLSGLAIAPSP